MKPKQSSKNIDPRLAFSSAQLGFIADALSTDNARIALTQACLTVSGERLFLVSTDSHRLHGVSIPIETAAMERAKTLSGKTVNLRRVKALMAADKAQFWDFCDGKWDALILDCYQCTFPAINRVLPPTIPAVAGAAYFCSKYLRQALSWAEKLAPARRVVMLAHQEQGRDVSACSTLICDKVGDGILTPFDLDWFALIMPMVGGSAVGQMPFSDLESFLSDAA